MRTRTIDTLGDFSSIRTEWNALLDRSRLSSPFLVHEWLEAWWTEYAGEHDSLRAVCYYDDAADTLMGVLPTYVERDAGLLPIRRLRFMGDALGSSLLDCLVDPDAESQVLAVVTDGLTSGASDWDVLDLRRMSDQSPFMALLLDTYRQAGKRVVESVSVSCPIVTLPADWEQYLGTLSHRERGRLRRLRRDLDSVGVVKAEKVDDPDALPEALNDVVRMFEQSMSRKYGHPFTAPDRYRRFLASASGPLLAKGSLRLLFLTVDGERIAFLYQLRHKDGMYATQTAFDESWASHHVGFVLFGYAIEDAVREGCSFFNFGVGVGPYKLRFAADVRDFHGLRAYGSSPAGLMAASRDATARWSRNAVKRLSPRGVSERLGRAVNRRGLERL